MKRRTFLLGGLAALAGGRAHAQAKVARIGVLVPGSRTLFDGRFRGFRDGLAELGYVEGKSLHFEFRHADAHYELLPQLTRELIDAKVDLIFTASGRSVLAAQQASKTIPIVFGTVEDALASGIVDSFARPRGNATGLSALAPGMNAKRVELLKEAVPRLSSAAFLWAPGTRGAESYVQEAQVTANALRLELKPHAVRDAAGLRAALESILKERTGGIVTTPDPVLNGERALLTSFVAKHRLPAIYAAPEFMDAGGMMAYAPHYREMWRRAATFAHKILRGAKPSELPVELPTTFELAVNVKAARALGVDLPRAILARADRVIE